MSQLCLSHIDAGMNIVVMCVIQAHKEGKIVVSSGKTLDELREVKLELVL